MSTWLSPGLPRPTGTSSACGTWVEGSFRAERRRVLTELAAAVWGRRRATVEVLDVERGELVFTTGIRRGGLNGWRFTARAIDERPSLDGSGPQTRVVMTGEPRLALEGLSWGAAGGATGADVLRELGRRGIPGRVRDASWGD